MVKQIHTKPYFDRRQRRINRRKQEIVAAAARVFAEKGYANTTTKELAEAADMAEGTLYNYFEGKREILMAIVNEAQLAGEKLLKNVHKIEGREDIITLIERGFDLFVSQLPFTRALIGELWIDDGILRDFTTGRLQHIVSMLKDFIAEKSKAGLFRPIDPETLAYMVIGMFVAPILPAMRGVAPVPTESERRQLAETVTDVLLEGVRIPQTVNG